ncbi:MAG TPA: terminase small subunit [Ardenticatenaceae bacterium]|jgi:phage terminase small subunit
MSRLTPKQQLFITEYLQCWNGTEAARRAGYSPHSARQQASSLLQLPKIMSAIEQRLGEHVMTADEALARLAQLARADLSTYLMVEHDEQGRERIRFDFARMKQEDQGHLIRSVRINGTYVNKLEFFNTQKALLVLAQSLLRASQPAPQEQAEDNQMSLADWELLIESRMDDMTRLISMSTNVHILEAKQHEDDSTLEISLPGA